MEPKRELKGQSGIELAVYFSFLLMLLIVLSVETADRTKAISRSREILEAQRVGEIAAANIDVAVSVGDGYSSKFYLPFGLTDSNYSLQIFPSSQRLEMIYTDNNFSRIFPILTNNVTGSLKQGQNRIRNVKGEIIID
ncbi:hypothetical protein HY989_02270 [Candidatus Micrarchaeota archaeon]|nr:hypothetical protein [Candidatus Micrarchaeota archaeon]